MDLRASFASSCKCFFVLSLLVSFNSPLSATQDDVLDELATEAARQRQIADRFLTVLERNPRRGTALERVYGHHVEFGTLDEFLTGLREKAEQADDAGAIYMVLGLLESYRGEDGAAVDAFAKAEELRSDDALASYYLGQAQLMVGLNDDAVKSFERAIERNPARADTMEIFQQLGRVHARAQRDEEALAVWTKLEEMFPDDLRVLEQIAITLVEEGKFEPALPRYQKLAEIADDDYRKSSYRVEVAQIKIRLGDRQDGIDEFEKLLNDLNPEGWLYRDVRRRVEDVFLRSGDQDGLVKYYEQWIENHNDDVEAMTRLARFLAGSARVPEANEWLEKAITKAPTRVELRRTYIAQLIDQQKFEEAVAQFELLAQISNNDPDVLRDWGKTILRIQDRPQEELQEEAVAIWRRILEQRPDDALTASQVADLLRQNQLTDEAIELYQKAIELAPNDPQYREYLGEYYHVQKETEKALETWTPIAEGSRRNAQNLSRLAEVLSTFGYDKQSTQFIAEAVELDPKDLSLHAKAAEYFRKAELYDESLEYVKSAEQLAQTDAELDAILEQEIDVLRSADRLRDRVAEYTQQLESEGSQDAVQWRRLARYQQDLRQWGDAMSSIRKALELAPESILVLTTAQQIAEFSGDYGTAANFAQSLADIDRRSRGDHLMNVARLQMQLGRREEALAAGRALIESAPGNTDHYEFFAQLCFSLGENDQGLETLRKAVRINPTSPPLTVALGTALANQFRTQEAIEIYWRAFDNSTELEDFVQLTKTLSELYLQVDQFDQIIEKFKREQLEDDKRRLATICLAQAHHTAGDFGSARTELESLLTQNTRDTELLLQLSKLCEAESESEDAISYQRELVAIAPGYETEFRLATLLQDDGNNEEAVEIISRLVRSEEDPNRMMRGIDSLLRRENYLAIYNITLPLLRNDRDNWELLYREALSLVKLKRGEEAKNRFERILELNTDLAELGILAEERLKQSQAKAKSEIRRGGTMTIPQAPEPIGLLSSATTIASETNFAPARRTISRTIWTPSAFGEARFASYAWIASLTEDAESRQAFLDEVVAEAEAEDATRAQVFDALFVELLQNKFGSRYQFAKRLAQDGSLAERQYFLQAIPLRSIEGAHDSSSAVDLSKRDPLSEEEIDLMMESAELLLQSNKSPSSFLTGNFAFGSDGTVYIRLNTNNYVPLTGYKRDDDVVLAELKLAGLEERAESYRKKKIESAKTPDAISATLFAMLNDDRPEEIAELFERWKSSAESELEEWVPTGQNTLTNAPINGSYGTFMRYIDHYASRSETAKPQTTNQPPSAPSAALPKLTRDEAIEKVLATFDLYATQLAKATEQVLATPAKATRNSTSVSGSFSIQYYSHGTSQREIISFPTPNRYVSNSAINVLVQANKSLKQLESNERLRDYLEEKRENSPPEQQFFWIWQIAALQWWDGEEFKAIKSFEEAASKVTFDDSFQLELAKIYMTNQLFDESLEVVNSINPRDQRLLREREIMALTLSERLGNVERARQAAERLFGLRLSTDAQFALANRMRGLGMSELADTVVNRVRRRAGGRTESLPLLMTQYQADGNMDKASEIAFTILRRSKPTSRLNTTSSSSNANLTRARSDAIKLLERTGRLEEQMKKLEDQLASSPSSLKVYDQLMEFYSATGKSDQQLRIMKQAQQQFPDNAALQLEVAGQLNAVGDYNDAFDLYIELLKKDPSSADVGRAVSTMIQVAQRAKRSKELAEVFLDLDLSKTNMDYYRIQQLTETLMRSGDTREIGEDLLMHVVESWPAYASSALSDMIRNSRSTQFSDKMFGVICKAQFPAEYSNTLGPWTGIDNVYSISSGGTGSSAVTQFINSSMSTQRRQIVREHIEASMKSNPQWIAGKALLAILDIRFGDKSKGVSKLAEIIDSVEDRDLIPGDACWLIAQELQQDSAHNELAIDLLKRAVAQRNQSGSSFQYTPGYRLFEIYRSQNDSEQANELLLSQLDLTPRKFNDNYDAYRYVQNVTSSSSFLLENGFKAEVLFSAMSLLDSPETLEFAVSVYGSSSNQQLESWKLQLQNKVDQVLRSSSVEQRNEIGLRLLELQGKFAEDGATIGLMLRLAKSDGTDSDQRIESTIASFLVDPLESADEANELLEKLGSIESSPDDRINLTLLQTLAAQKASFDQFEGQIDELLGVLESEKLPSSAEAPRLNSKQRAAAHRQIGSWLVARECLANEDLKDKGLQIASHAVEAAERANDPEMLSGILLEWSQIEWEQDRKDSAEEKMRQLLQVIVGEDALKRIETSQAQPLRGYWHHDINSTQVLATQFVSRNQANQLTNGISKELRFTAEVSLPRFRKGTRNRPPSTLLTNQVKSGTRYTRQTLFTVSELNGFQPQQDSTQEKRLAPLTLEKFKLALEIASIAAERGFEDLSFDAINSAFVAGPPIEENGSVDALTAQLSTTRTAVRSSSTSRSNREAEVDKIARTGILRVCNLWEDQDFDSKRVYETLASIVMPDSRPGEFLLYADRTRVQELKTSSIAEALAQWCIKADQAKELLKRIDARNPAKTNDVYRDTLALFVLYYQTNQTTAPEAIHDEIETRVKRLSENAKGATSSTLETVAQVTILLSNDPRFEDEAFPVLEFVAKNYSEVVRQSTSSDDAQNIVTPLISRYCASLAQQERFDDLRNYYQELSRTADNYSQSYGGTYGLYLQSMIWASIAKDAAKHQQADICLEYVGYVTDQQNYEYRQVELGSAYEFIYQEFSTRAREEQYRIWHDWVMPTEQRRSIRFAVGVCTSNEVTSPFASDASSQSNEETRYLCSLIELVNAAADVGQLDKLAQEVEQLDAEMKDRDLLRLLLGLKVNKPVDELDKLVQKIGRELTSEQGITNFEYANAERLFVVYDTSIDQNISADAINDLEFHLDNQRKIRNIPIVSNFYDSAKRIHAQRQLGAEPNTERTKLSNWITADYGLSGQTRKTQWQVNGQSLVGIANNSMGNLISRMPLVGDYQLEFETQTSVGFRLPRFGTSGLLLYPYSSYTSVGSMGGESYYFHSVFINPNPRTNRIRIVAEGEKIRFYVNSELVLENNRGKGFPFFVLGNVSSDTLVRNLKVKTDASIPDQVDLVVGNALHGWVTSSFNNTQPTEHAHLREYMKGTPYESQTIAAPISKENADWYAENGVLTGRKQNEKLSANPQWAFYSRPLETDESITYEYYYSRGSSNAHPSVGRFGFLLSETEVTSVFLSSQFSSDADIQKDSDFKRVETEYRRGPERLPLKNDDWNQVKIHRTENQFSITLNGELIFEKPWPDGESPTIGFYHEADVVAKIREITLDGSFSERNGFDSDSSWLATSNEFDEVYQAAQEFAIPSTFFESTIPSVITEARESDQAAAFELLHNWVLPYPSVGHVRLHTARAPYSYPGITEETQLKNGELLSPAWELAKLAAQLGRTDELIKELEQTPENNYRPLATNLVAFRFLLHAAAAQNESALEVIDQFRVLIKTDSTSDISSAYRTYETPLLQMCWFGGESAALRPELAALIAQQRNSLPTEDEETSNNYVPPSQSRLASTRRSIEGLETQLKWYDLIDVQAENSAESLPKEWDSVAAVTLSNAVSGSAPTQWTFNEEQIHARGDEAAGALLLKQPLQGEFEVEMTQPIASTGMISVGYGFQGFEVSANNGESSLVYPIGRRIMESAATIPEFEPGKQAVWRLKVTDELVSLFVNDVNVYEHPNVEGASSWLSLFAPQNRSMKSASEIVVTGTPTVAESVQLINDSNFHGWRAWSHLTSLAVGGNDVSSINDVSSRRDKRLVTCRLADGQLETSEKSTSHTLQESLIQFARPMLEDGEVTYEFYYSPGEVVAYPAIGQTAILFDSEKVKRYEVHQHLYGVLDRTHEELLNDLPEEVHLTGDEWNQCRLVVKGDQLTVFINDEKLGSTEIKAPAEERFIGLFHFANESTIRVRNMVYRGEWGKELSPSILVHSGTNSDPVLATEEE